MFVGGAEISAGAESPAALAPVAGSTSTASTVRSGMEFHVVRAFAPGKLAADSERWRGDEELAIRAALASLAIAGTDAQPVVVRNLSATL